MTTLTLEIREENGGISVSLSQREDKVTKQEQLFAAQMGKTIYDFLNNAPKATNPQGN